MVMTSRQIASRSIIKAIGGTDIEHIEKKDEQKEALLNFLLHELVAGRKENTLKANYFQRVGRYFPRVQIDLLAEYLGIKDAFSLTIDKILLSKQRKYYYRELVNILKIFLCGKADSIKTAHKLDKFSMTHQPKHWQFWRFKAYLRHGKLLEFIESFKSICIKDVLSYHETVSQKQDVENNMLAGEKPHRQQCSPRGCQSDSLFYEDVSDQSHTAKAELVVAAIRSKRERHNHSIFMSSKD